MDQPLRMILQWLQRSVYPRNCLHLRFDRLEQVGLCKTTFSFQTLSHCLRTIKEWSWDGRQLITSTHLLLTIYNTTSSSSSSKFSSAPTTIRTQVHYNCHIKTQQSRGSHDTHLHNSTLLGCIYTDTSMSTGSRIRVPVNTSLHVFQWWPFTLTQVLYEYELPVNFTRTSSFWAGCVFIQLVRCKQRKIYINLIYTRHDAHFTS